MVEVAYKGKLLILIYQHNNHEGDLDIRSYMNLIKEKAINIVRNALNLHKNIKINLELECDFKAIMEAEITHKFQLSNIIL